MRVGGGGGVTGPSHSFLQSAQVVAELLPPPVAPGNLGEWTVDIPGQIS